MKLGGGALDETKVGQISSSCMCNFHYLSIRFETLYLLAKLSQTIDTILNLLELPIESIFREADSASLPESFEPVLPIRVRSTVLLHSS